MFSFLFIWLFRKNYQKGVSHSSAKWWSNWWVRVGELVLFPILIMKSGTESKSGSCVCIVVYVLRFLIYLIEVVLWFELGTLVVKARSKVFLCFLLVLVSLYFLITIVKASKCISVLWKLSVITQLLFVKKHHWLDYSFTDVNPMI